MRLQISGLVVTLASGIAQAFLVTHALAQDLCANTQSMAEMRDCQARYQELETNSLRERACGAHQCLIRLSLQQRRGHVSTYRGGGYTFIEGETINTGNAQYEFGARLIDPSGQQTIVGQCGGTACGNWYAYVSGPLRDAELTAIGDSWLLKVPK